MRLRADGEHAMLLHEQRYVSYMTCIQTDTRNKN